MLCVTDVSAWVDVGAMQDIVPWSHTNSGQEQGDISQFHDHSSAMSSGKLGRKPSETSLVTSVSTFSQPPSRLYSSGMPTPDALRSMWYTDTPTIQDSFKDCFAMLHSNRPNSSSGVVQHPGAPASHTPVKRPIHGLRNIPSDLSQLSRPSTGTSISSSLFKPEIPRSLDHPTTTFHSPQQSPFGLDNKESSPSEQLANGSESYRRPLPKPPKESSLRRTQSSSPSTATSTHALRLLPPTPLLEVSGLKESRIPVSGNSHIHSQSPPMTKASQELTRWVHELTDPQLPSTPLPVFDLPPPSYSSIYFAQPEGAKSNYVTTPTTTAPST